MSGASLSSREANRWVRDTRVLTRSGAFGVVLLARHGRRPVTLQGTGVELWAALATPHSDAELIAEFAQRYVADPGVVAADLVPVLDELRTSALIAPVP